MKLNLKRPLVVFDLETTGLDLVNDRIIQLSYIKVSPDGTEKSGNELINPGKEIPKEVTDLTGITNEMVKDAPTFKQRAAVDEEADRPHGNAREALAQRRHQRVASCRTVPHDLKAVVCHQAAVAADAVIDRLFDRRRNVYV